ncbi:MAG: wax ester/triacylglycerol synthase family O-acyltransferase [Nocardioidaceae bacterium]
MGPRSTPSPVDRLSANDAMMLAVDRGAAPMNIAGLLVLAGDADVPADLLCRTLGDRVVGVPRLRQVLTRTPPGLGRPIWVRDPDFTASRHLDVRVVGGPAPGGPHHPGDERVLLDAAADLVVEPLPRDRPLWRVRVLADPRGRARGVVVVLHHVVADGMGGLAALAALVDEAEPPALLATDPGHRPPRPGDLARDAWAGRLRALRRIPASLRELPEAARELGLARTASSEPCSLLTPTGSRRRVDVAEVGLAELLSAARRRGASVNDLVVTAVSGALVALLDRRGERLDALVVSVPVSARAQAEAGGLGNATGVLPVRVPAVDDPAVRLDAVMAQSARLRAGQRGSSSALLTPVFRLLAGAGLFQRFVDGQRLVHTFETNLRGPERPLHLGGARIAAVLPVVVNPGNVTVAFDVLSYDGRLRVVVVSDPDRVPEAAWLAGRLDQELAGLCRSPDVGHSGIGGPTTSSP